MRNLIRRSAFRLGRIRSRWKQKGNCVRCPGHSSTGELQSGKESP